MYLRRLPSQHGEVSVIRTLAGNLIDHTVKISTIQVIQISKR